MHPRTRPAGRTGGHAVVRLVATAALVAAVATALAVALATVPAIPAAILGLGLVASAPLLAVGAATRAGARLGQRRYRCEATSGDATARGVTDCVATGRDADGADCCPRRPSRAMCAEGEPTEG